MSFWLAGILLFFIHLTSFLGRKKEGNEEKEKLIFFISTVWCLSIIVTTQFLIDPFLMFQDSEPIKIFAMIAAYVVARLALSSVEKKLTKLNYEEYRIALETHHSCVERSMQKRLLRIETEQNLFLFVKNSLMSL
jgi:hypothetical protein